MAVTCWSYMAVRKLISLNRNASNFPWAIILCPQQNKRVIFLKMRELKSLIKATVNVVLLIADTAVFTSVFPVRWCLCVFLGRTWGEERGGITHSSGEDRSCSKLCKSRILLATNGCFLGAHVGLCRCLLLELLLLRDDSGDSHTAQPPAFTHNCLHFCYFKNRFGIFLYK